MRMFLPVSSSNSIIQQLIHVPSSEESGLKSRNRDDCTSGGTTGLRSAVQKTKGLSFAAIAKPPHGRRAVPSPLRAKIDSLTPTSNNRYSSGFVPPAVPKNNRSLSHSLPGPQKRGTGGTLIVVGIAPGDWGHPPNTGIPSLMNLFSPTPQMCRL